MRKRSPGNWVLFSVLVVLCLTVASSVPYAGSAGNVTGSIQLKKSVLNYDRKLKQSYLDVSLQNISSSTTLKAPITVVVESITPASLTVANAEGFTGEKPYFLYNTGSGLLAPGERTGAKKWKFDNPNGLRFSFTVSVWAEIEPGNRAPTANAGPDQTAYVATTVTLNGTGSTDPEGDPLTYQWSFLAKPAGSIADLSNYQFPQPNFYLDRPGSYELQLVVNDGTLDSAPDTVVISTLNSAPVANAGLDQTTYVTRTVTLDGSASTDIDGNALAFSWLLLSKPSGSSAVLSNPTTFNPTFTVDVFGNYTAQLTVNDGTVDSAPDSIVVSTQNSPPVANAGQDQSVSWEATVTLNGSGSSDVDGNSLTFSWSLLSRPDGSSAALSNPASVTPTFVADVMGDYVAQLIVNDGTVDSAPDTVTISTFNSTPVAHAGPDQTLVWGKTVHLDGSASSDADGNELTYQWSFLSYAGGVPPTLSDAAAVNPTFVAEVPGDYILQLLVNDGLATSAPDTVTISATNTKPVAEAGPNQTVLVGAPVTLNGSGSTDADGNPLSYSWSFTARPAGSTTTLSNPIAVDPTFTVDRSGTYVVQLIVNDGMVDSLPDTVTVSTENSPPVANAGPNQTVQKNSTASLDGSASSDVDGNPLTFLWSFSSRPPGSAAALSDPTAVDPTFVADKAGVFVLQLLVNDGFVNSSPSSVTITTENTAPAANAGPDQTTPFVGSLVTLDGSDSNDFNGDTLTFQWSLITRPPMSGAALANPTAVNPTFTADAYGTYVAQLIVNDGTVDSPADTVTISTQNSPPVANAGSDKTKYVTDEVTLDSTASYDVDGNTLTRAWSFVSRPAGSAAVLSDPTAVKPTFVIDRFGTYDIQLIVNDGTVNSAPDTVRISTLNSRPVANAGPDQTVAKRALVTLNGAASSDVDENPLTYSWSFTARPAGSTAVLANPTSVGPTFTADVSGNFILQLIVNDGTLDSNPDTVVITTLNSRPVANAGTDQTAFVLDIVNLDGSGSSDSDVGDLLTYSWSLITRPVGSTAAVANPTTVNPSFIPDLAGDYIAQLIVNDGTLDSLPDTTLIIVQEKAPTIITLSPSPVQMLTRSTLSMTVHLDARAGVGGLAVNLSPSNSRVTVPATVTVPQGEMAVSFTVTSGNEIGEVDVTASATGLTSSTSAITVLFRSLSISTPLVGIERTVVGTITLLQPAPTGGATFNMSVANSGVATVSPASITIPQGSSSGTFQLTGGSGVGFTKVTADGTASGYEAKVIDITVTDRLIDLPAAIEASLGSTHSATVLIAPDAAPAEGVEIGITSSNPSLVEVLTPTVTVPAGAFQATLQIRAAAGATGSTTITASNPGFAPDTMQVTITSGLNILETFSNFDTTETASIHVQLESAGVPYPAPAGGVSVPLTASDPTCVAISPASLTVVEGASYGMATLSHGGTATIPCTTTVTANSALFGTDTLTVTVGQTPDLGDMTITDPWANYYTVGGGLQKPLRLNLATGSHGGVTVQITSGTPSKALVAADSTKPGAPVTELAVPNGQAYVDFYLQGVRSSTGTLSLKAKTPRFTTGTQSLEVVQPALYIQNLSSTYTSLDPDTNFYVSCGVLNAGGTGVQQWQGASAGAGPLPVTFTSSDPAVAVIKKTGHSGASETVYMPVGQNYTPQSMATGGVAFDPLTGGTTTVSATAPGSIAWTHSSRSVSVSQPAITITDPWANYFKVGAGLQKPLRLNLDGSQHGGVDVHVVSSDGSVAKLSPDSTTAGAAAIDVHFNNGESYKDIYIQDVSGLAGGSVTVTATESQFTTGTATIEVVQSALYIQNLSSTYTSLDPDTNFYVSCGVLNAGGTGVQQWQGASAGAGPLPVTFTSSDPAVAVIKKTGHSGASETVYMPVGQNYTPQSMATGGVAFDPLTGGTTTVSATAPGSIAWTYSSRSVSVSQPAITITDPWANYFKVGAGLQKPLRLNLGGSQHGGVDVHVVSSDGSVAKLSPDSTTAGAAAIDFHFNNGESYKDIYIQDVSGLAGGSVTITATESQFTTGTATIEVVQPALYIQNLSSTYTSLDPDTNFYVSCGVLNAGGTGVQQWQGASAGAGPLPVTFTSSDPAVAVIKKTGHSGASETVYMPVGQNYTPQSMATGGVAFDPLTGGTTTVSATAPGSIAWTHSSMSVSVSQPAITITDPWANYFKVGAGLQKPLRLNLDGSQHGGVDVHVVSSDGSVAKLSPDSTTAGAAAIDVHFNNGESYKDIYIQDVSGLAGGSVTVTATESQFTTGSATIEVVQPALYIQALSSSYTSLDPDTNFYVSCGVLNAGGTGVQQWQGASAGAGPLPVTFTSSDPAVAVIKKTGHSGASETVYMPVGQNYTPQSMATGGVAFDPLTGGTTTVSATAPGSIAWTHSSMSVSVSQPAITITDPWANYFKVGGGLQKPLRVTLGGSQHGGVTVRVSSGNTAKLLLSANTTTVGTSFLDISFNIGDTYKDFYVQGINGMTGSVTITGTQTLFATGSVAIEVAPAVVRLGNLPTSIAVSAANTAFYVQTGVLNDAGTGLQQLQNASPAGPIHVLLTSSNVARGQLITNTESGAQVTVDVPVNSSNSPTSKATGGVEFDPVAVGTTTVSAEVNGFNNSWSGASSDVNVTP